MKPLVVLAGVLALVFFVLAAMYATQPAGALPAFLPGHEEAKSQHHHLKHALGCGILGLACLVFAWFQTGPKASSGMPAN